MIVSIAQPAYLPWLGYFHRVAISDLHIVLDHVPIGDRSFTNRNKARTPQGSSWLTVPLRTKGELRHAPICDLEIADDGRWQTKHWATLLHHYSKGPHFSEHRSFLDNFYKRKFEKLFELIDVSTSYLFETLEIGTRRVRSSEMRVEGKKENLILNLCKAAGATIYLSGPLGRDYLDEREFLEAGIRVHYHDYVHPVYPQMYPGFEPCMSALDLLFNCGRRSREILMQEQEALAR